MTKCSDLGGSTAVSQHSAVGNVLSWPQWQRDVLQVLRTELQGLAHHLRVDDVDWSSWQAFYEQGRTPRSAVDRALERDL